MAGCLKRRKSMSKHKYLLMAIALFLMAAVNAQTINGAGSYKKEALDELYVDGIVKLDGTTITKCVQVNGTLSAKNASIEKMNVNGLAMLDNCLVIKKSTASGALNAESSQFSEELFVSSEKVVFDSCTLTSLYIAKAHNPIVELKGKTKINGSVTFESNNGKVIMNSDSVILGKVIGGTIKH